MRILGIETSCDETAVSLVDVDEAENKAAILGNSVHSQIEVHASYGGVFPVLAKREHAKNLVPVLKAALEEAGLLQPSLIATGAGAGLSDEQVAKLSDMLALEPELLEAFKTFIPTIHRPDVSYIAVTVGPGLEPALWVGINFARALAYVWNIPVIPCNHMEGHILTALIQKTAGGSYDLLDRRIMYPALSLLISGGHTQIVLADAVGSYKIVGETRDDAIGECFDKVARTLGLAYPGGPKISKLADEARAAGIESPEPLPRPMIDSKDLDFSFSGLKTAALYLVRRLTEGGKALDEATIRGIAREVEDSVVEVVATKMRKAIELYAVESLVVGGGVVANAAIRSALERLADDMSVRLLLPQTDHATDNALMIALAGYFNRDKALIGDEADSLKATGTLPIGPREAKP